MDFVMITLVSCILAVIGVFVYVLIENKKYKHIVQIREIVNGRKIIKYDRARDFEDDDKSRWWKLKKEKNKNLKLLEVPSGECIEIDNKGRKNVVVYRDSTGSVKFANDGTVDLKQIKNWHPVTSEDRVVMINQIKKAENRKGKDWKQNMPMFVGGFMLLIVIVLAFVFIEDVAKPFIESKELQLEQQEIMLEQTELLKDLKSNVQTLENVESNGKKDEVPD